MDKCYNEDCDDYDETEDNGCYFSDFPNKCIGFVSEEMRRMKEEGKDGR